MKNERLINARLGKNWTQEEACAFVDVPSVRTWQRWENEGVTPSPYFRKKLCEVFNTSLEGLGFFLRTTSETVTTEEPSPNKPGIVTLTQEQAALIAEMLSGGAETMNTFDPSKRETLAKIFKLVGGAVALSLDPEPWERLSASVTRFTSPGIDNATFHHFERLLSQGWELSNLNELTVAEGIIASFLPRILSIPLREVDARIAYLASQGLRLQSILHHHRLRIAEKVQMCQQSVEYARYADDATTLVAALLELAIAYKYSGQVEKWFKTIHEALCYVAQASPLVQSQAYLKSALAFAAHKRQQEAELYVQMGFATFPDHPEHDPGYALADASVYTFSRDAGRVRLEMGQVSEAYSSFELYKSQQHSSALLIPERLRLEIVNGQSKAALVEKNLDKYAGLIRDGLAGAVALGSRKRFDEVYTTFREDMPTTWLSNSEIQAIAEQYHLVRV